MNFGLASHLGGGTVAVVGTTEVDLWTITDGALLINPQINVYYVNTLGTHTSLEFKYYARFAVGGAWFELPYRAETTGVIASQPSTANASTPLSFIDSLPMPACLALKGTVKGVAGANGSSTATVMGRDN